MSEFQLSLLSIFIGGGVGASSRHFLSLAITRAFSLQSFWGILAVNLIGCLLIGILSGLFLRPPHFSIRLFLVTGFLGSFTTYSTFMLDIVGLFEKGEIATAAGYLSVHLVAGFALCFVGLMIGRALIHA